MQVPGHRRIKALSNHLQEHGYVYTTGGKEHGFFNPNYAGFFDVHQDITSYGHLGYGLYVQPCTL